MAWERDSFGGASLHPCIGQPDFVMFVTMVAFRPVFGDLFCAKSSDGSFELEMSEQRSSANVTLCNCAAVAQSLRRWTSD